MIQEIRRYLNRLLVAAGCMAIGACGGGRPATAGLAQGEASPARPAQAVAAQTQGAAVAVADVPPPPAASSPPPTPSSEAAASEDRAPATEPFTALQIFDLMVTAWEGIDTYICELDTYARSGTEEDSSLSRLLFKKPGMIRMDVIGGEDKGAAITRTAEGKNRATPGGALRLIRVTMADDDKRHMSVRGIPFFKSDWGTILGEIRVWLEEGWVLERLPDTESDGRPAWCLRLSAPAEGPRNPPDVDRQIIHVCPDRHLMLGRTQYLGDTVADRDLYTKIELNPELADDRFDL